MITVYSKNNCAFCAKATNFLNLRNIPYQEVKIDENLEAKEFILSQGHRTVPQLYFNGKLFVEGGFQGLTRLTEDQLKEKLSVII